MNLDLIKRALDITKILIKENYQINKYKTKFTYSMSYSGIVCRNGFFVYVVRSPVRNRTAFKYNSGNSDYIIFYACDSEEYYCNDICLSALTEDDIFLLNLDNLIIPLDYLKELNSFMLKNNASIIQFRTELLTDEYISLVEKEIENEKLKRNSQTNSSTVR